jgi:hypothetical protein
MTTRKILKKGENHGELINRYKKYENEYKQLNFHPINFKSDENLLQQYKKLNSSITNLI